MITAAWLLLIGIGLGNTAVTATGAAVTLLASLPELGRLSRHEIAALVHDAGFATAKDSRDCATLNIGYDYASPSLRSG